MDCHWQLNCWAPLVNSSPCDFCHFANNAISASGLRSFTCSLYLDGGSCNLHHRSHLQDSDSVQPFPPTSFPPNITLSSAIDFSISGFAYDDFAFSNVDTSPIDSSEEIGALDDCGRAYVLSLRFCLQDTALSRLSFSHFFDSLNLSPPPSLPPLPPSFSSKRTFKTTSLAHSLLSPLGDCTHQDSRLHSLLPIV